MSLRAVTETITIETKTRARDSSLIPSLNGIRAISVTIVVLAHSGFGNVIPGGFGVTIFFFLSGFLITTLFLREYSQYGCVNVATFYLRRAARLMPPLIVTILISYALVVFSLLPGKITLEGVISQIAYFANYYIIVFDPSGSTIPAGTGIFWSLAVEEHFYIFYPIILVLLLSLFQKRSHLVSFLIIFCAMILAWRTYLVLHGADENRIYYATDTRVDSIVFGCILALGSGIELYSSHENVKNTKCDRQNIYTQASVSEWFTFLVSMCILLFSFLYHGSMFRETWRYTIQGMALMPVFYVSIKYSSNSVFSILNNYWLNKIGIYSYFIYLIHFIVINALINTGMFSMSILDCSILFLITFALSILYAALIDKMVDPYFRSLRHILR